MSAAYVVIDVYVDGYLIVSAVDHGQGGRAADHAAGSCWHPRRAISGELEIASFVVAVCDRQLANPAQRAPVRAAARSTRRRIVERSSTGGSTPSTGPSATWKRRRAASVHAGEQRLVTGHAERDLQHHAVGDEVLDLEASHHHAEVLVRLTQRPATLARHRPALRDRGTDDGQRAGRAPVSGAATATSGTRPFVPSPRMPSIHCASATLRQSSEKATSVSVLRATVRFTGASRVGRPWVRTEYRRPGRFLYGSMGRFGRGPGTGVGAGSDLVDRELVHLEVVVVASQADPSGPAIGAHPAPVSVTRATSPPLRYSPRVTEPSALVSAVACTSCHTP